jgi:hypothetical protein
MLLGPLVAGVIVIAGAVVPDMLGPLGATLPAVPAALGGVALLPALAATVPAVPVDAVVALAPAIPAACGDEPLASEPPQPTAAMNITKTPPRSIASFVIRARSREPFAPILSETLLDGVAIATECAPNCT